MDNTFEREREALDYVENHGRHGNVDCDTIAAAAAFSALQRFDQEQQQDDGETTAKETLAGWVYNEVYRLVETMGLDYVDRERARRIGVARVHEMYDQKYGEGEI